MMPDHLGEFIAARHNANASAATIREMVTQLAIAAVELERWEQANVPYKPGRRRGADPFAGDLTWPSLENAAAVFQEYRTFVRDMDAAYAVMLPEEKHSVSGPAPPPPEPEP
jgi:hypothetical protein